MILVFKRLAATALAVLFVPVSQDVKAVDWSSIADSYGQWTVNTANTALLNSALEGQAGVARQRVAWPDISDRDMTSQVLTIQTLRQMSDADLGRMRSLLRGQVVTIQGIVRPEGKSAASLWLIQPGISFSAKGYWGGGGSFHRPADGSVVNLRGVVREVNTAWVELSRPEIIPADATPAMSSAAGASDGRGYYASSPAGSVEFTRSPAVSEQVNTQMAEIFAAAQPGVDGARLHSTFHSGELQREFARLIQPYGFSDTSLADVMAAYLILSWQVIHDDPDLNEPGGYRVMRDSLRQAMLADPGVTSLGDIEKQVSADTMILTVMMAVSAYTYNRQTGDGSRMLALQEDVRGTVQTIGGLDLRRYRITHRGLIADGG